MTHLEEAAVFPLLLHLVLFLLLLVIMLLNRHGSEVFFTAHEAQCASHPGRKATDPIDGLSALTRQLLRGYAAQFGQEGKTANFARAALSLSLSFWSCSCCPLLVSFKKVLDICCLAKSGILHIFILYRWSLEIRVTRFMSCCLNFGMRVFYGGSELKKQPFGK